jgi:hypothetical protein
MHNSLLRYLVGIKIYQCGGCLASDSWHTEAEKLQAVKLQATNTNHLAHLVQWMPITEFKLYIWSWHALEYVMRRKSMILCSVGHDCQHNIYLVFVGHVISHYFGQKTHSFESANDWIKHKNCFIIHTKLF